MHPSVSTDSDDAVLFARARDGDHMAFGELVRRHQAAAMRLAATISGSTEEAKDIVQDGFVKVHGNMSSYRGTGSVRSWMLRVVANEAKNHVRSRSRRVRRDRRQAQMELRTIEAADEAVDRRLELTALASALDTLPTRDREVLACRFVTGLSEAETSEVLGVAAGTVKSRTSRALRRLHAALEAANEVGPT